MEKLVPILMLLLLAGIYGSVKYYESEKLKANVANCVAWSTVLGQSEESNIRELIVMIQSKLPEKYRLNKDEIDNQCVLCISSSYFGYKPLYWLGVLF